MRWDDVIGQEQAVGVLRRALAAERVAHAYLFYGPEGAGKRVAALAFAQALLCTQRGRDGHAADGACGACDACRRAGRLIHPDLHVFMPFPRKDGTPPDKDPLPDDYAERLARLAAAPYVHADYRRRARLDADGEPVKKQAVHRVGPMRDEVHRRLTFKPVEGGRVVGVLLDAEHMNKEAANAFLKLLEEPPPRVVLVLTAERLGGLLPTILSRCQRVRFEALAPETIEAALVAREGTGPAAAARVARTADGSYSRALALLGSADLQAQRALALQFLREAYSLRPHRLLPLAEQAAAAGREGLRRWLGLLRAYVRDALLLAAAGPAAPIVNVDEAEALGRLVANLPHADLPAMARALDDAEALLQRNVHTTLVLAGLAIAFSAAMRGRGDARLVLPLDEPPPRRPAGGPEARPPVSAA
ncbi:MAG: ATP-binding protein [Rubricoccaceae bacterium]